MTPDAPAALVRKVFALLAQAWRDRLIVALRRRGWTYKRIGRRVGMRERREAQPGAHTQRRVRRGDGTALTGQAVRLRKPSSKPCSADSIAYVRRLVRLTLADELVPAPSDAEGQAGIYRELLNYRPSDELRQHIMARLTRLQQLDPSVKLTPLGDGYLGAKNAPPLEKPEQSCPDCNLVHKGECL